MKDFAAIDFETANGKRSSVCSVGIVIVRDGKIVDKIYSLIKPYPNYYSSFTTEIHGLTKIDTDLEECFPGVWQQIHEKIEGLPLVAHNRPFDEGCLKAVFKAYDMDYPGYEFHCTLAASRRCLRLPNYRLNTVSRACGYDLEHHHHALADAEACSAVCVHICKRFGEDAMFGTDIKKGGLSESPDWRDIEYFYNKLYNHINENDPNECRRFRIIKILEQFKYASPKNASIILSGIVENYPEIYNKKKFPNLLSDLDFVDCDPDNLNDILRKLYDVHSDFIKKEVSNSVAD